MKFGIFDHIERLPDVPIDQQYRDRLELVAQAEKGGFYGYHVAEHHHSPLCLAPNQAVYLAAIAQHTQHLRFGPLVYVLPIHHPIRLLEEICMVDNLSNGRFQVGIGRGTGGGQEFAMWGGNPDENDKRFDETFRILMQGFRNDFLSFDGSYYHFQDLWMELKPKQTPHPPLWYAGNPIHAAEYGANFIGRGTIDELPAVVSNYLEARATQLAQNDPMVPYLEEPLYGASRHIYLAETDEEAVARARTAYRAYGANFHKPVPPDAAPQPRPAGPRNRYSPGQADFDTAVGWERFVAGSPDTVREHLTRYAEKSTCNYFVGSFQWGDLTHEEASRSMGLFMSEVMPSVAEF
jgi:alkanesulfonate monooxygenase SsuD/methylene tetrahydromethanopterin reductase-like flavin-dependent oxidoreductase (luciferase family)